MALIDLTSDILEHLCSPRFIDLPSLVSLSLVSKSFQKITHISRSEIRNGIHFLALAARHGYTELIRWAVEYSFGSFICDELFLWEAISNGHINTARCIIQYFEKYRTPVQYIPLTAASKNGYFDVVASFPKWVSFIDVSFAIVREDFDFVPELMKYAVNNQEWSEPFDESTRGSQLSKTLQQAMLILAEFGTFKHFLKFEKMLKHSKAHIVLWKYTNRFETYVVSSIKFGTLDFKTLNSNYDWRRDIRVFRVYKAIAKYGRLFELRALVDYFPTIFCLDGFIQKEFIMKMIEYCHLDLFEYLFNLFPKRIRQILIGDLEMYMAVIFGPAELHMEEKQVFKEVALFIFSYL